MFQDFALRVQQRLQEFNAAGVNLFWKANPIEPLFETYLAAFPAGTNPIFRERTTHDCNCCKQFIRGLGGVVYFEGGQIHTLWELDGLEAPYDTVAHALHTAIINTPIERFSPFLACEPRFGTEKNYDNHDPSIEWHHFFGATPTAAVFRDKYRLTSRISDFQTSAYLLRRALSEFSLEHLDEVLDLISENALYRGAEFGKSVQDFRRLAVDYQDATAAGAHTYFHLQHADASAARFRNTVIGTLLVDRAEGKSLEDAVRLFEQKVAPQNYKRPKALVTSRMVEDAVKCLQELGLESAIHRRHARHEDLVASDLLFVDSSVSRLVKGTIQDLLKDSLKPTRIKPTSRISIDSLLGLAPKEIRLVLENRHLGNFVSVTAPETPQAPPLFKWNNGFAWSYDGDVADSIKERVKAAGGKVDARLRVSLAWSNLDDLDIHLYIRYGSSVPLAHGIRHIFFGNRCGILDVDANANTAIATRTPVENLAINDLVDGTYLVKVDQFRKRESTNVGFELQVEYESQITTYSFEQAVVGAIQCLSIEVAGGQVVKVTPLDSRLKSGSSPVEKWGIKTLQPVRVTTAFLSPNHWHESGGVGNKHFFFVLQDCLNPEPVRGIYNEFLGPQLEQHRKVFELIGSKVKCAPSDRQLSGVGFSSTRSDTVSALVDGRPYTVVF